ncbi:MAG: terminase gpP N-terminus-related DNA-binding protein [Methanobacterium sp.]
MESISNYRRRIGLPSHRKYCDYSKCMELYQRGYNDVQIASELGLAKNTVGIWRKRNGLPTQNAIQISGTDRVIEEIECLFSYLCF